MTDTDKNILSHQNQHWENMFSSKPDMFGNIPSESARIAAELFRQEDKTDLLELGGGQGRDTLFFAQKGFRVQVLDYSLPGVEAINQKAAAAGLLSGEVTATCHDIRTPLPFENDTFDACYSHMLYCMALTTPELEFLSNEILRVLKPGGLNIYTVRHTGDADFGTGIHRGEDLYEISGFIVHFFSEEKVKHLAQGYDLVGIDTFEEGALPKKLFRVTLKKPEGEQL